MTIYNNQVFTSNNEYITKYSVVLYKSRIYINEQTQFH